MSLPVTNTRLKMVTLVALVLGGFALSVVVALPDDDLTWSALQNFGHFLLFAFLGWAVLRLLYELLSQQFWKSVLIAGFWLMALGVAIELFQLTQISRSTSVGDLLLDAAGMLVGFLLFTIPMYLKEGRKVKVAVSVSVIVITVGIALVPVVPLIGFDVLRPAMPVVRSFDHPFSDYKIETTGGAHFSRQPAAGGGCCTLQMVFNPALYSGVIFRERSARWSDYDELSINIFSSLPSNRQIALRINDGLHNNLHADRYNTALTISPGLNRLRIPLTQIEAMGNAVAADREMDINDVTRIQFFTSNIESSFALELLSIELF